jgi:hypothetical protein
MFGFLKRWVSEANEVSVYQKELCSRFSEFGVNFMELNPTIHKTMLRTAWIFDDVDSVVEEFQQAVNTHSDVFDLLKYYTSRLDTINHTMEQYKIMSSNLGEEEAKRLIRRMYKDMTNES